METSAVLWRCRRGIREMDLLLQQFVTNQYSDLSEKEKQAFLDLLDESDLDIMDWIMERKEPVSTDFKSLVGKIRNMNGPIQPVSN